ncbi:MAG: hypothetical protein C4345_15055 [Chloroflexota bacterium]
MGRISIQVTSCGKAWTSQPASVHSARPSSTFTSKTWQCISITRIDNRPDVSFRERPWNFCTPGFGHDARWWRAFIVALHDVGYDDVLSIENEDPYLPGIAGVERTVAFLRQVL